MINNLIKKIVIGSEVFSGSWGIKFNLRKIRSILSYAYEQGINEIDTAPIYGKKDHEVEKKIGNILKKEKLKFLINTKFTVNKSFIKNKKKLCNSLNYQLENSLKSLKRERIDNYFFHSGTDEEFFVDDLWEFLNKKKKEGLIKNICLSIKHDLVKENSLKQLKYCKSYGVNKISTVCNLYSRESLKRVIPFCKKNKIFIYGRMPLAKGLLTGKYSNEKIFNKFDPRFQNLKLTKKIMNFSKTIKNLSAQKAVSWSLKNCDKVVLGFKSIDQIKDFR